MKISFKVPSLFRISTFVMASVVALGFAACDKNDGDPIPVIHKAHTAVLNLLPGIDKIDIHAGTTKLNASDIENGVLSAYLPVNAGEQDLSVYETGDTEVLVNRKYTFERDKTYSIFAIGEGDDAELIISDDNLGNPSEGKVKIRFANLVDQTEALDLWVEGGEDALAENVSYKTIGAFVETDPAEEVSLSVKVNGQEEDSATLENVKLEAGKIYTVYAHIQDVEGEPETVLAIVANK